MDLWFQIDKIGHYARIDFEQLLDSILLRLSQQPHHLNVLPEVSFLRFIRFANVINL